MSDPVVGLFAGIIAGVLFTWVPGLLPAVVARYVVTKRPLKRASANWIAAITCVMVWFLAALAKSAAGSTLPVNVLPLMLMFFVARWIMVRDPAGRASQRRETLVKLQAMIDDPKTADERRAWALDRLAQIQKLKS